ncbi:Tat pathway signal protein [Streptomyces sp. NPDC001508]|uniref:Tat pathway signal protein n=1 Tax=Streptomyces sp. NPDC001508 TaxID=3154656 RepID=UPI0033310F8D
MARERNKGFAALLGEAGWSRAQAAAAFVKVARENQLTAYTNIQRQHVTHWVAGHQPSGRAPIIMCEALSRRLKRVVTTDEAGFTVPTSPAQGALDWRVDPLIALNDLGRTDLDADRRSLLRGSLYSAAALVVPSDAWWAEMAKQTPPEDRKGTQRVGRGDVESVREMVLAFSHMDQRRGGGHGRTALVEYLRSDVAGYLVGKFPNDQVRRDMYSAAAEGSYLSGWMAFDNGEHGVAERYFTLGVKLAARVGDAPLSGHIFRAMAHQALDLGFFTDALALSTASIAGQRYQSATPRERALLGVVHARCLAANEQKQAAAKVLLRAEDDLRQAHDGIEEPSRTFFFAEASLAHETACTLRDLGDSKGAIKHFRRSVRTRGASFKRTHAVTLGYLGATQVSAGNVEEACATWSSALDAMEEGIYSGRARQQVVEMRQFLSPYRRRGIAAAVELESRAADYLRTVD